MVPSPLVGEGQGGGKSRTSDIVVPPPLTPPHKGEGDPRSACLAVPSFVSDPEGLTPDDQNLYLSPRATISTEVSELPWRSTVVVPGLQCVLPPPLPMQKGASSKKMCE